MKIVPFVYCSRKKKLKTTVVKIGYINRPEKQIRFRIINMLINLLGTNR